MTVSSGADAVLEEDSEEIAVIVNLQPADVAALDAWITAQPSSPSRSDAVQMLVQQALSCFNPNTTSIRGEFG